MLNENIKSLRKAKGFSQDELATQLHVVRQTVSKWEKGISVPDADTLIRLADIFHVEVSDLLGEAIKTDNTSDCSQKEVAEQLAKINEQLAAKNMRTRRIIKTILIVIAIILSLIIIMTVIQLLPGGGPFSGEVNVVSSTQSIVP